jgi:hypothetical protein
VDTEARKVAKNNSKQQTITIDDHKIPVVAVHMRIGDVHLDPDNPRIREDLKKRDKKLPPPSKDDLQKIILELSGVSDLLKSIRDNKGLHEPIYVRHNGVVAEGNCRTAIYLKLHQGNPKDPTWQKIDALILPDTVTERQIAVLQGHLHVTGKITWRKHEQAGHLYTMKHTYQMAPAAIAKALGMREKEVEREIRSYELNLEVIKEISKTEKKGDSKKAASVDGRKKFSTIHEIFKVRDMEEWRAKPANIETFKKLVVEGKIKRGSDVRKLSKIVADPKALEVLKKDGFDKALHVVGKKDPTADAPIFGKLKATAEALKTVSTPMIKRLKDEHSCQTILQELFEAVKEFAATAGVSLK